MYPVSVIKKLDKWIPHKLSEMKLSKPDVIVLKKFLLMLNYQ